MLWFKDELKCMYYESNLIHGNYTMTGLTFNTEKNYMFQRRYQKRTLMQLCNASIPLPSIEFKFPSYLLCSENLFCISILLNEKSKKISYHKCNKVKIIESVEPMPVSLL